VWLTHAPLGADRAIFTGDREQVRADVAATRAIGAAALHFDLQFAAVGGAIDGMLRVMEDLYALVRG
jgi:hypothetical protein